MSAIEAATVKCSTLVDGTLRLVLDFEPRDAQAAFRLFGAPGRGVAVAGLKDKRAALERPDTPRERSEAQASAWSELGTLCQTAIVWGDTPEFRGFLGARNAQEAGEAIKRICQIESRKELDTDPEAAARFHKFIKGPYQKFMLSRHAAS